MGRFTADTRYIASIYPGKVDRVTMNHGPSPNRKNGATTWYELKPVKRGTKPYVIEIADSFQHSKDEIKSAVSGTTVNAIDPVSCDEIADYLIRYWTGNLVNVPQDCLPGIMKIRGTVAQQSEIQQMKDQQEGFFEYWYSEGERLATANKLDAISPIMKLSCDYLGRPRGWANMNVASNKIDCPACKASIPGDACVCQFCGTKLRALPASLRMFNESAMVGPTDVDIVNGAPAVVPEQELEEVTA